MPSLIPHRFLIRLCHPVPYFKAMPLKGGQIVQLPDSARLESFATLDDATTFAEIRLAWNELGIGLNLIVDSKKQPLECNPERPMTSDGLTIAIDTRGDRTGHRGSRTCHLFTILPTGGGADRDEPVVIQSKINRALNDAPFCRSTDILTRSKISKKGYSLEVFFTAEALNGYDPEEHPQLGITTIVRDQELGDQFLGMNRDFPILDDPSLWNSLELVRS